VTFNGVGGGLGRDSSVVGYALDDRGCETRQRSPIFLFTTVSRPAFGPTQPPIQWVTGALSLGLKRPGRETDYSPFRADVELYLHSHNTSSGRGA